MTELGDTTDVCAVQQIKRGFLFHVQDAHLVVNFDDSGALEFLDAWLLVSHYAAGAFGYGEVDEALERELEDVVGGYYQKVIVDIQFIYRQQQVADCAESCFVCIRFI